MGEDQLGICLTSHSSIFTWTHIRELYHLFSEPILHALKELGINARFRSKNDLEVEGKKIAGLGIHVSPDGGIQFHSSLLLDLDIPTMLKALKVPIQKFSDKRMIHSIEERMSTVRRETGEAISMNQLMMLIRRAYEKAFDASLNIDPFTSEEQILIDKLAREKYQSDEWRFQLSPQKDMDGMSLKKTKGGLLRTYIGLKGEIIKSVLITGDFLDMPTAFAQIESQLKWSPLDKDKITDVVLRAFHQQDLHHADETITTDDVVASIWLAAQRALAATRYTYKGSCYYPKETTNA